MTDVRPLDLQDPRTRQDLVALQRAAYRVEADLIGSEAMPALRETPEQLAASGETFLGAFDGGLVGAISYKRSAGTIDIHRLVVHPRAFRRGVATRLLAGLPAGRWIVTAAVANAPAVALYDGHGFRPVRERTVEGLRVIDLERPADG